MGATSWSDEEDTRIDGLPWIAQLVYLRGLRRHMDYSTGIVGQRFGISRATIARALYIEPKQGRGDFGEPSKKAITKALEMLENVGLIEKIPSERALIFRLPYADTDKSVSEKWGRFGADLGQTKQGRPETSNDAGCGDKRGRFGADPQAEKWGTSPVSGIREDSPPPIPPPSRTSGKWMPPPWINVSAWAEFERHRVEMRKPLSNMARTKAANLLRDLTPKQQQACIDQSIQSRWAGLFPEKIRNAAHQREHAGTAESPTERRRRINLRLIDEAQRAATDD